jgi:hypothetical protein
LYYKKSEMECLSTIIKSQAEYKVNTLLNLYYFNICTVLLLLYV